MPKRKKRASRPLAKKSPAKKRAARTTTRKTASTREALPFATEPRHTLPETPTPATKPAGDRREELRKEMQRSLVTEPLLTKVQQSPTGSFDVIIALNEFYEHGIEAALKEVRKRAEALKVTWSNVSHYVFARLTGAQILALADEVRALNAKGRDKSVIFRIWEDSDVEATLIKTLTTIKADAAQRAFHAVGQDIVWAVMDSGIDASHPHFKSEQTERFGAIDTLNCPDPVVHMDFTLAAAPGSALEDQFGHGTHVAGIIAGHWRSKHAKGEPVVGTEMRDEATDNARVSIARLQEISGVAPLTRLVSMKVIADRDVAAADGQEAQRRGKGKVSWILKAIEQIHEWNQHGKRLHVHGVNMSVGYDFDARWWGCGQSPICTEVNRLVRSGVVVVVSAGNSGYKSLLNKAGQEEQIYNGISITDPGNSELAITVGSTHRDMPHLYGVSYFSSRGPTGDGRRKPDLLAPGERVWSCATGREKNRFAPAPGGNQVLYCEQSGTSMAAPHVSGAIAAFLSVRREFIGLPERVKTIVMQTAIDLGRVPHFQGAGLLDVMKILHAV
jgi:subtilisin family serine protease